MKFRAILPLLLLWIAAVSFGQAKPAPGGMDNFQFHTADMQLMQAKPVQAELKMTEAQRAKMNEFAAKHRKRLENLEKEYEKKKKPLSDAENDPVVVGYYLELKTNVMLQLSKAQLKRISELSLQRVGMAALTDDVVAKKVGMTTAQLGKFRDAFAASGKQFAAAQQKAAGPIIAKYKDKKPKDQKDAEAIRKQYDAEMMAAMKKAEPGLRAIQASAQKKLDSMLTPAQKTAWKAVQGKPFVPPKS